MAWSYIDLAAQNRLNSDLGGLIKELYGAEHIPMIGNGYGVHSKIFGLFQQLSDPNRTV
jgi:hypothetical protein